jgi:phage terminase small subunit
MSDAQPPKRRRGGGGLLLDADGFTAKERRYIQEIQIDWNGRQAAIRAGYSTKSASDIAYELNRKTKIVDAIMASMSERAAKAGIDANWVLIRLVDTERKLAGRKKANPLHRLRALELIGRHVNVNAFRTQFGLPGGGSADGDQDDSGWDFTRLDDEEFETLGRLLRKCSVRGGAGPAAADPMGAGEGSAAAEA